MRCFAQRQRYHEQGEIEEVVEEEETASLAQRQRQRQCGGVVVRDAMEVAVGVAVETATKVWGRHGMTLQTRAVTPSLVDLFKGSARRGIGERKGE